jgi:hypothetical protein
MSFFRHGSKNEFDEKKLDFDQPLFHFPRISYSWQVALQQSLLPLGLSDASYQNFH